MKFFTWKTKPKMTMIAAATAVVLAVIRNYQVAMMLFQQEQQDFYDLSKSYWSTLTNGVATGVTIVRVMAFIVHNATHMFFQGLFWLAWYLEQVRFATNNNDKIITNVDNDDYTAASAACEDLQGLRSKAFADLDATRTLRQIVCHSQLSSMDDDGQYHRLGTFVGFSAMTFTLLLIIGWYCGAVPNLVTGLWYVHDYIDRRFHAPYRPRGPGPWLVHAKTAAAAAAPEPEMTAVDETCSCNKVEDIATPSDDDSATSESTASTEDLVLPLLIADDVQPEKMIPPNNTTELSAPTDETTIMPIVDETISNEEETAADAIVAKVEEEPMTESFIDPLLVCEECHVDSLDVSPLIPADNCATTGGALADEATIEETTAPIENAAASTAETALVVYIASQEIPAATLDDVPEPCEECHIDSLDVSPLISAGRRSDYRRNNYAHRKCRCIDRRDCCGGICCLSRNPCSDSG
jgi:hypothetical protein